MDLRPLAPKPPLQTPLPVESPLSGLHQFIQENKLPKNSPHPSETHTLALQVAHNLRFQHGWTEIELHYNPSSAGSAKSLPRPVISGLPPKRMYVHPDEQMELLQHQWEEGKTGLPEVTAEREWVLASQLREMWSLRRFADVFDALSTVPPAKGGNMVKFDIGAPSLSGFDGQDMKDQPSAYNIEPAEPWSFGTPTLTEDENAQADQLMNNLDNPWRTGQPKRLVLATLDDDSTVVYYIIHDGIVKPRQN